MAGKLYKNFLRNYYLSFSLYDLVFAYAVYAVLFSMRGLSVPQISLLFSWWALAKLLLEIPSGALADYWSRKKLLIISPLIKAICFIVWFFADGNFYLYALGLLFWSLSSAFVSGTTEALLYDNLVSFDKKNKYEEIFGRKRFYKFVALAMANVFGGLIAHYNINWTLTFSTIPLLLASYFAILLPEVPRVKSTEEVRYLEHIKTAYKEVKRNKILVYLIAYSAAISFFGSVVEFNQLYYELVNLPLFLFGVAEFLWTALVAIGSYYAYKFSQSSTVYFLLPLLSAFLFLFIGLAPSVPMIGLLILIFFISSPLEVLTNSKIQHNIKSTSRATVTSVNALLVSLFSVVSMLVFGLISKIWNLQAIYFSSSLFLAMVAAWTVMKRKLFLEIKGVSLYGHSGQQK